MNLDNILAVRFERRTREPTADDLKSYEAKLTKGHQALWGSGPSLHYFQVSDSEEITLRPETQREKLEGDFKTAQRFIDKLELEGSVCFTDTHLDNNNVVWFKSQDDVQAAKELRERILNQEGWATFINSKPDEDLDIQESLVNLNNVTRITSLNKLGADCVHHAGYGKAPASANLDVTLDTIKQSFSEFEIGFRDAADPFGRSCIDSLGFPAGITPRTCIIRRQP